MRVSLSFLLPLCLAAAPLPVARTAVPAPVDHLAPDSAARWVPFTLTPGNQIRFDMTLDGRPVSAVLDTGLSYSVVSRAYAAKAHLPIAGKGDATVIGGVIPIGWAKTQSLRLGGLERSGGKIVVADVPALAAGGGAPVDLLVGPDLLKRYALDIDYAQQRFRLLPSGRLPFRGASAPLRVSPINNTYLGEATLDGTVMKPMVIDTGDGAMVTVTTRAWHAAEPHPPPTTTAISYGLGGTVVTDLAIMPKLTVGDLDARHIEVRIEPPGGFSETIGAEGRIGSGFLQRYRVLLDPDAGRMVFSPNATADAMPIRSTSGLLLGFDGDRLRVMHVMRGSPAAAAGWRRGETICHVDGAPIPANYPDSALAEWSTGAPGRLVTLGMCDGATRQLRLRYFY